MVNAVKKNSALRRFALSVAGLGLALALPATAQAKSISIVVDAGHGGHDPGAMSSGIREKDTNLQIARLVAKDARRQGWKVSLTRDNDRFISLNARPRLANKRKADAFVSIHGNSTGRKALGAMTIYRSGDGKRLGKEIMRELSPMTPYGDIGNRRDVRGLAVLRGSKRPAVIIEVGSVTAPREKKQLKDHKHQEQVAQAIVRGIAHFKHVDYKPVTKPKPKPKAEPKKVEKKDVTPETKPRRSSEPTVSVRQTILPRTASAPAATVASSGQLLSTIFGLLR